MILDLGCGQGKRPGTIGIDINPESDADIIHDLELIPWPLKANSFDRVICRHILEHLDDVVRTMEEIYRVSKEGGIVDIVVPHFSSAQSWDNPTHKRCFTLKTFGFFQKGHPFSKGCAFNFDVVEIRLEFSSSLSKLPARLMYSFSPRWYEKNFSFIIPARNIKCILRVRKEG